MQLRAKSRRVLGSVVELMKFGFERHRRMVAIPVFELQPLERRLFLDASPSISGDTTVMEGSAYTLNLSSGDDSNGEGIAFWTINWDDNNTDNPSGDPSTATHTYPADPGTYTISASVTENATDSGGYGYGYGGGGGSGYGASYGANTWTVTVEPYAPVVSLSSGTTTPLADTPFTLNVSTSYPSDDPDGDTVGSIYVDWGDNTNNTYYASDYGGTFPSPLSVQHTYASGGNYTISSTASDDDTTSSPATLGVSIGTPAAPIPYITGGYQVGSTAIYNLQLENLAANSTIDNWVISWGDGSAPLTITGNANSVTHQFIAPSISDMITATAIQSGVSYPSNRLPIVVRPTSTTSDPPSTNVVVNFQPALSTTTPVTPGYVVDQGHAFSDQANWFLFNTDYCYGWDDNYSDAAVASGSSDPRANTYIPMQSGGVDRNWFIGLADGTYQVHIVSGYNSFVSGSRYQIDANGTQVLDGTPSSGNTWVSGTATVSVTDRRLTVSNGPQATNNIIDYIEISPTAHLSQVPTAPSNLTAVAESDTVVNLNWIDNSDNESNFIVQRSSDGGTTYSTIATLGMDVTQYSDTGLTGATNYTYRIVASNTAGSSSNSNAVTTQTLHLVGGRLLEAPYGGTTWPVPGRIEAENFDTGGQGVGYSDEDSINLGGQYRRSGVDIGGAGPTSTGWMVGWTTAGGAYMNYTVNVLSTGYYRLDASVASDGPGGTFHVEVDGTNVTGSMTIPDTGGWLTFNTISSEGTQSPPSGIYLTQGTHVLKLSIDSPGSHTGAVGNFDWLQFASMSVAVPIAPTNLKAAPLSSGQVQLSWQDFTSNATGYTVQRSNDGGITFATVASSLSSTATSFTDTTASAGAVYIYRVEASNGQGASYPSNAVTILTSTSSAVALDPAADTYVDAANPTSTEGTSSTLDAEKVSDGSQDKHIYLRFDTSSITGTISGGELRLFGMLSGASREGVTLSVYGVNSASTTWSDSSSFSWNTAPSASGAALSTETCNDSTGQWYQFDVSSFLSSQISAGHRIVTLEVVVAGNNSDAWQFTSKEGGFTQPVLLVNRSSSASTPALSASPISTSQINLSWDFSDSADGYYVERSTDGFTFSQITDTVSKSYSDTGLTAGTAYWYRVRAHGSGYGESPYSNTVATGTTAPTPFNLSATAISGYQVNLSWTNGSGNQGGIDIERSTDDVNFTQIGTTTGSASTYSDTTASATTTYYYRIRAYGPGPSSPYTSAVSVTTLSGPNPASNLTAVVTTSSTVHSIALAWADNSTNETGFQIQRSSTSATSGFSTVTTTAADVTTYTDSTATVGSVYWYRIVSVQNSASGGPSNVVKTALPQVSSVAATEGGSFSGTVAYFTDSTGATADYTATITWGDGNSSAATITADPNNVGRLLISGTHSYNDDGNYTLAIALIHTADSVDSNTTEPAVIADAALSISPATVDPSTGEPFSGPVATFTDANPNGKLSDYTATIDWQDGRGAQAASVQTAPGGGFEIIGTHTWTNAGSSSFVVTVKDAGGSQASTTVTTGPATTAAPGGLAAHADWMTPASQIDLSWYDAVGSQSGIYVERSTDDVTFTQIANLMGTPTTYQDSGLSASTTYYYRIRSYGSSGDSAYVGPVSATTAASNTQATPTLQINGGDYVQDGQKLPLSVVATPAVYVDPSSYVWNVSSNGTTYDTGSGSTYIFSPNQSGTYTVTVSLQASGSTVSASENVTVAAVPPQHVTINGPAVGQTGHELTYTSSANAAPGTNPSLGYKWSVTLNESNYSLATDDAITDLGSFRFMPTTDGQYVVSLQVTSSDGSTATFSQPVVVTDGSTTNPNWTQYSYYANVDSQGSGIETGESITDLGNNQLLIVGNVDDGVFVSRVDVKTESMSLDTTFGALAPGGGHTGSIGTPLSMKTQVLDALPFQWDVRPGVAIQSDGKIVIAASFRNTDGNADPAVERLNSDGSLDTSFGMADPQHPGLKLGYTVLTANNFATSSFHGGRFAAVSIDSDGRIVAAGFVRPVDVTGNGDFAIDGQSMIARFNADGSLDDGSTSDSTPGDSFGTPSSDHTHNMGTSVFSLANEAFPYDDPNYGPQTAYGDESIVSLVPIAGGKFMAGAWTSKLWTNPQGYAWTPRRFTLARISADGTLDTSFGTNGSVITTFPSSGTDGYSNEILGNLFVQPDGKFVAVGSQANDLGQGFNMAVARYNADGTLDTTFASTSQIKGTEVVTTTSSYWEGESTGDDSSFASGALDANGNIVIAGAAGSTDDSYIARLSGNGALDPTFGSDGEMTLPWDPISGNLTGITTQDVAVDQNGAVFVTGSYIGINGAGSVAVARYEPPVNKADNLVATAASDGSVNLTWRDDGASEDGFVISRRANDLANDGAFQTIGYVGPNTTVFNDSTVNPSTTYDYKVAAYWGTPVSQTQFTYNEQPDPPTFTIKTGDPNSAWQWVETDSVPVNGSTVQSTIQLKAGVQYMLVASGYVALDTPGDLHADAQYGMYNPAPTAIAPSGWYGGAVAYGIAVDPGASTGLTRFPYWGSPATDPNHTYSFIYTPLQDENVKFDFQDNYYPDNSADSSKYAGAVPFTVQILQQIPTPPTNLTATADRVNNQVALNWSNSPATGQQQIQIERSVNGGDFSYLASVPAGLTSYTDAGLSLNTRYSYRITTNTTSGTSTYSNDANVLLDNEAPVFQVTPKQMANASGAFTTFTVTATDPDPGDTVTYMFSNGTTTLRGISGTATINATTGQISGTVDTPPDTWDAADGAYPQGLAVVATDSHGATSQQIVNVFVPLQGQTVPTITSGPTILSSTLTSATLQIAGAEGSSGDANLSYSWRAVSIPDPLVLPQFSINDSHGAGTTTVTFGAPGIYKFDAYVSDPLGLFAATDDSHQITITVTQTPVGLAVIPNGMSVMKGGHWTYDAIEIDQFGNPMGSPLTSGVTWTVKSGGVGGTFTGSTYNAPDTNSGGVDTLLASYTDTAHGDVTVTGTATIGVQAGSNNKPVVATPAAAMVGGPSNLPGLSGSIGVSLSALGGDDAGEANLIYQWQASPAVNFLPSTNWSNSTKNVVAAVPSAGGNYTFTVTIIDSGGLSVQSSISIQVPSASTSRVATSVAIMPAMQSVGTGGTQSFTAKVLDQFGTPMPYDSAGQFTWTSSGGTVTKAAVDSSDPVEEDQATFNAPATAGDYTISVSYTGISQAATTSVSVVAPAPPMVKLTSPTDSGPWSITTDTDLDAMVVDPMGGQPTWTLTATPTSGGNPITLAQGKGSEGFMPFHGSTLTTLHPLLLGNGSFMLTLTAQNSDGVSSDSHLIQVSVPAQGGGMTLPVVDMSIPTGGLPIVISRMYDSTQASQGGDLGYGWRLELPDLQMSSTAVERGDIADDPAHPAYADGDIVSFILPSGDIEQFQFTPQQDGSAYVPAFTALNGSTDTLAAWTATDASDNPLDTNGNLILLGKGNANEYYEPNGNAVTGYNPTLGQFGNTFVLTNTNGTVYTINATTGMVSTVKDANGNVLDYSHFFDASNPKIISTTASGQSTTVTITRDGNGHITAITDPQNNSIHYGYDAAGELTSFTDRATVMVGTTATAVVTHYGYGDSNLPHFLTTVTDPRGVQVLTAAYDDTSGALISMTDAFGKAAGTTAGPQGTTSTSQSATDLAGSSNAQFTDDFGNVTRQIQSILDDNGNVVGYQVMQTDYAYQDADGDLLSATQWVPFTVPAPDPTGLRFTQKPTTIAKVTAYYTVKNVQQQYQNDLFLPYTVTVYGPNSTARVTTFWNYVDGNPQNSSQVLQTLNPDGTVASQVNVPSPSTTSDGNGNLTSSTDALGNVTYFSYEQVNGQSDGHQTASYRIINGTTVYLTQSTYYGSTNSSTGAVAGMLATSTDANGKKTFYSYTANGDVAASWSLSGNGQWVVNETFYDPDGRQTSTTQAIYSDASPTNTLNTSGFTNGYPTITESVVQAPVTESQTGYNLIGQTDTNTDQYGGVSRFTYDAHGNVIRTLYPDGTEQRSVYDSMNRVIWQTDAYASTTTYNSNGTYTNDNTTTANATFTLYDSQGRVIGTQRYSGVLISMGSVTVAGGVGLPTTSLTTQGTLISTAATYYDADGRVVEADSVSGLRTAKIYYPTGQVQYAGIVSASARFGGPFTTADFDPASAYTEFKYDSVNDTMPSGAIYFDATTQHVFENGAWTTRETDTYYDADGKVIQTSYPDGSFTQTLYGLYGQPIASSTLSALGITPPNSTTEGWPGVPAGGQEVVKIDQRKTGDPAVATFYLYDVAGNLLDVWQPAVNVPYASVAENDHPAGYWRLGEISGTTASDSSANSDNGTDSSVALGQSGALSGDSDTAASFNGSSSNVSLPDSASLDITSHLTLECWINYSMPNGGTGAPGILTKDDGYIVRGYGLYAGYTANQHLEFALNVGGSAVALTTQGSYNDGHWHYVVATYDGSMMKIYVDGSLVASMAASGAIETNSDPLMIGSFDQANADSHFDGKIDEAAVYNYALSATQISAHYTAASGTMQRPHWQYTYDHDGNQLTQIDPQGNVTSYTYDALGRELSRTLPDGQTGGSNATHETETFTYDQYGNQIGHVDFNGNTTVNTYYTTGVHAGLIQEADYYKYPDVPSVNSPDETVIYGYDSLNRKATVTDSANGSTPTTYTYDPITQNIASITSPEGVINYVYNPATGQEVRMIASHSGTVTDETDYAYDPQGRLIDVYGVVVQGTVYATFAGLDSNGNPTFTGSTPLTTAYTYDPLGNLASETDSDNTQTSYTYDVDNHLTALATVNTATGKPLFAENYDLDDNGLRKDVIDTRYNTDGSVFSQTKIAWTYDDEQRLTNETLTVPAGGSNAPSPYSDSFRYDLSNNRMEEDIDENDDGTIDAKVGYTYNGDNQLKSETRTGDGAYAISYGYDNNGSLTTQVKTGTNPENDSYGYDARNRMTSASTSVTDGSGTITTTTANYDYDDIGVRVSEATSTTVVPVIGSTTTTSVTTYYLNDPQNPTGYTKAVEETSTLNSPTISRSYVLGSDVIVQDDSANGLLYLVKDGHGSTRALVRANGSLVEQYNYDAFGTLLISTGAQSDAGTALTSWLFGGDGIYDQSTGWTYRLSRFTDDFHFTSLDSRVAWAGDLDNTNLYAFVAQNPLNWQDPLGTDEASIEDFGLANEDIAEDAGGFEAVYRAFSYGVQKAMASEKQAFDEIDAEFAVYQAYTEAWKTIAENVFLGAAGAWLGGAGEAFAAADEGVGGGGAVTGELEELGGVESDGAALDEAALESNSDPLTHPDPAWVKQELAAKQTATGAKIYNYPNRAIFNKNGDPVFGRYYPRTNKIRLFKGATDATKFHELLHAEHFLSETAAVQADIIKNLSLWRRGIETLIDMEMAAVGWR